jgi:glycosyltransferase involved in cell wall biosynthesis
MPSLTLRQADGIIALTQSEFDYLRELGVEATRITVIPNGVNVSFFHQPSSPEQARHRWHLHGRVVLYVGRLNLWQKGLRYLLEAFAVIARAREATLVLCGQDQSGAVRLRELGQKLGILPSLRLTGNLEPEELPDLYACADVVVLPSVTEAFGLVLLEAMAAGKPVVASAVGGVPEVVQDGVNGLLVPPRDSLALANALERVLANDELRSQMSARARDFAAQYSWDKVAHRTVSVYRALLEGAAASGN